MNEYGILSIASRSEREEEVFVSRIFVGQNNKPVRTETLALTSCLQLSGQNTVKAKTIKTTNRISIFLAVL